MASLFGQDEDEDEKFKQMLGGIIGQGPAPYDMQTPMEQPEQSQLSAPYMPQGAAQGGIGGYTPPPAAAAPAYLDRVEGHQFGGADIAMLGGILAALVGGGKHRGEIAGSLAGQYGGAVMQANGRADQRNQQVDQYNNQLENKANDPLERWKLEQMAKSQAGNLDARGKELDLQKSREQRIGDAQAAEDAKDPIEQARLIEEARSGVRLDTKRKENDMDVGTREMLGQILGKQKGEYASPVQGKAATLPDGTAAPLSPEKALKQRLAQNALSGMDDGSVDPLTGKPVEKPKTPAQLAAEGKDDLLSTPFPGSKIDNDDAWRASNMNPAAREKHLQYFNGVQQVNNSLERMKKIRETNGTEAFDGQAKSEYDSALTAAIGGFTQIGQSGVLNGGEFARYKDFIPGIGPKLSDLRRLGGGKDPTLEQLQGVQNSVKALAGDGLRSIGISFDDKVKPSGTEEKDLGESPSGIKFSADPKAEAKFNAGSEDGGSRTVTITYTDGETESFTGSDADIQKLRGKSAVRSVQ